MMVSSERKIPKWVTEEYFVDVLEEHVTGYQKIQKFDIKATAGDGENYNSLLLSIKLKVELVDGSIKDLAFIMKVIPPNEHVQFIIRGMQMFPKERTMYGELIPEFEKAFLKSGKKVTFGPQSYRFKKDPGVEYILLEDISPKGFKNVNRLEGLDTEHTESALKLLAEFHASSAVNYATKKNVPPLLTDASIGEQQRKIFAGILKSLNGTFVKFLKKNPIFSKYVKKAKELDDSLLERLTEIFKPDLNAFNVILHSDLWTNNIMFRHDEAGKLEETVFIDFQNSRFGSPVLDLLYFLSSSPRLDLKISKFDYFIKYYYDHLVENLVLLNYSKEIPTIKDLHITLLRNSFWGYITITSLMGILLLDPINDSNIDEFLGKNEEDLQLKAYTNPRYIKHVGTLLPWMDMRGFLD